MEGYKQSFSLTYDMPLTNKNRHIVESLLGYSIPCSPKNNRDKSYLKKRAKKRHLKNKNKKTHRK